MCEFSFTDGLEVDGRRRAGGEVEDAKRRDSQGVFSLSPPWQPPYHRLHGVLDLAGQGKEFNEQLALLTVQSFCCFPYTAGVVEHKSG